MTTICDRQRMSGLQFAEFCAHNTRYRYVIPPRRTHLTSPAIPRELFTVAIRLRGKSFDVTGFIEDEVFIPERFNPAIDYNSLSNEELSEISYQFWLQWEPPIVDDDSPEESP